jgi:regulator of replication initiation timing
MQKQRDNAQEALRAHASEGRAASAAQQSALARVQHMETQLAARVDELGSLRRELSMAANESEEWRAKGVALATQLDASGRAAEAAKARAKVLENQVQQRDDDVMNLKKQLSALMDSRCAQTAD